MVFTGKIDAGEKLRSGAARKSGGGEGLGCGKFVGETGFARLNEVVREEDCGIVHEFAKVLLRPGFRVVEAGLEFGGVERKAAEDSVVNGDPGFEKKRGERRVVNGGDAEGVEIKSRIKIKRRIKSGSWNWTDRRSLRVEPELGEFVVEAVWSGDDTEFFDAAPDWIGNGWVDGAPDGIGIFVEGEFGEDEIGAVAANGGGVGGEGNET